MEIKRVTIQYVSYLHLSDHVDVILGSKCQIIADGLGSDVTVHILFEDHTGSGSILALKKTVFFVIDSPIMINRNNIIYLLAIRKSKMV